MLALSPQFRAKASVLLLEGEEHIWHADAPGPSFPLEGSLWGKPEHRSPRLPSYL